MVREGERYRTKKPLKVIALTSWRAPFTGGSEGVLPQGEEFVVLNDPIEGATAVCCEPVRYEAMHSIFVHEQERRDPRYRGYHLSIDLGVIEKECERVGDDPLAEKPT